MLHVFVHCWVYILNSFKNMMSTTSNLRVVHVNTGSLAYKSQGTLTHCRWPWHLWLNSKIVVCGQLHAGQINFSTQIKLIIPRVSTPQWVGLSVASGPEQVYMMDPPSVILIYNSYLSLWFIHTVQQRLTKRTKSLCR